SSSSSGGGGSGGGGVSSAASSSSGAGGGVVAASWNQYAFDMPSGTWSTTPLSALWTSPNAPPPTGIIAAEAFFHFPKELVLADNGMLYVQDQGVWQPPVPIAARFPGIDMPETIDGMYSVPSEWNVSPMTMTLSESVTLIRNPMVWVFTYYGN